MNKIKDQGLRIKERKALFVAFFVLCSLFFVGVADAEVQSIVSAESGGFITSIGNIYKYAQGLGVALAILMITAGGIYIAISGASPSKQQEGKDMIKSAIFGLILLFGAVLILETINPELTLLSAPARKSISLGVRPCNRGDVVHSDLISQDCAFQCDGDSSRGEDAYDFLSEENKKKYGCTPQSDICTDPKDEKISEGKCTYFLKPCNKNEDPGYPPKCYAENKVCSATVIQACAPAVLTFGVASADLEEVRAQLRAAREACKDKTINTVTTPEGLVMTEIELCREEQGIDDLEAQERQIISQGTSGAFVDATVPRCGLFSSCKNGISAADAAPNIEPGLRYKRLPYYPQDLGPQDAACILVAYEKTEEKDGEQSLKIKDYGNRTGLKPCPTSGSGSPSTSTPSAVPRTPAEGGGGGGGATVVSGASCPSVPPLTSSQQSLHDAQVARFSSSISVNSTCRCSNPNHPRCTGLIGLPVSTINLLNKVAADCPSCSIQVTGGTETGHSAHGPGKPVVDLHWDRATAAFLKNNAATYGVERICTHPDHAAYRIACNYNEQVPHIHVKFKLNP